MPLLMALLKFQESWFSARLKLLKEIIIIR